MRRAGEREELVDRIAGSPVRRRVRLQNRRVGGIAGRSARLAMVRGRLGLVPPVAGRRRGRTLDHGPFAEGDPSAPNRRKASILDRSPSPPRPGPARSGAAGSLPARASTRPLLPAELGGHAARSRLRRVQGRRLQSPRGGLCQSRLADSRLSVHPRRRRARDRRPAPRRPLPGRAARPRGEPADRAPAQPVRQVGRRLHSGVSRHRPAALRPGRPAHRRGRDQRYPARRGRGRASGLRDRRQPGRLRDGPSHRRSPVGELPAGLAARLLAGEFRGAGAARGRVHRSGH